MEPAALIFDLDGTIVDNMSLHMAAFDAFAERHGIGPLSTDDHQRLHGLRNRDIFPILFRGPLDPPTLARYADEKEGLYRELSRGRLVPLPGLLALLDRADAAGRPVAIATSAPEANVLHSLAELGLAPRFPIAVRSDQVPRGKPHPDVFLAAAAALGVPADLCVAFEDAPLGLEAAAAAGMTPIAIATSFSPAALLAHGRASRIVAHFDELLADPALGWW